MTQEACQLAHREWNEFQAKKQRLEGRVVALEERVVALEEAIETARIDLVAARVDQFNHLENQARVMDNLANATMALHCAGPSTTESAFARVFPARFMR